MVEVQNNIQTYEAYKDSGVEWLGDIPEHWEATKVKNVFRLVVESAHANNDFELLSVYTDIGVKPRKELEERGNKASTTDGYWLVKKGDVVVNKLLAWMGAIGVSNYDGVTSPAYDILRAKVKIENNFYHYLFRNSACISELKKHSRGIMDMRLRLYFDKFGDVIIPYPNYQEQKIIVNFLDDKTTKIDKAIAIKQQQIVLLKERKQILIHKAVTRGLDDTVALKDSGVEWIGENPDHWEVKPLKYIGNSIIGLTYSPNDLCEEDEGVLVFRSSNLNEGKIRYGEKENAYVKSKIADKLMVRENDILICSRNGSRDLIGKCALISKEDVGASFGAFTTVFRSDINPYIFCILNSSIFKALSGSFLTSTINQLTIGNLNSIYVPVPPLKEQKKIKSYIINFSQKIETAISLKQQEIDRLQEYKGSLINSVVTGKVKVC
jgi:type I restriction enzyme S subunit